MPIVVVSNLYKTTGPLWLFRRTQKSLNNNTYILYTHTFSVHAFLFCVCMFQKTEREGMTKAQFFTLLMKMFGMCVHLCV